MIQSVKNEEILFELNLIKGQKKSERENVKSTRINHVDRCDGNIGGSGSAGCSTRYDTRCVCDVYVQKSNKSEFKLNLLCGEVMAIDAMCDSVVWPLFIIRRFIQLHKI